MTEVRRNEFEIDLRVKGFERAVRDNMFKIIEEITVQRQSIKEMSSMLSQTIDVLTTLTQNTGAIATRLKDFDRRNAANEAIFEERDG